jgi:hypothetical protein
MATSDRFYGSGITNNKLSAPTDPVSAPLTGSQSAAGTVLGSGNVIQYDNRILDTDMLRPFDVNQAGRGATYQGPVAMTNNAIIGSNTPNNGGYNQFMMQLSQHFDPMMQIDAMTHPRWWYNRVPRSSYKLFDGTEHETRIFRGGLYSYAGLSDWQAINPTPSATNDPCSSLPYTTAKYGWESLKWTGMRRAWGSDPICLDMFKYFDQAQQQLAWILSVGAQEGIQIQEVWNRDMFIYQSVAFGRSFIMTKDFYGPNSPKYFYDPFLKPSDIQDATLKEAVGGRAYALIPCDHMPEPLNFDVLDQVRESLKIRCPRSAVTNSGGDALFALAVSHNDIERYIRGNEEERRYWIEADPTALIKHDGFAPSTFRRWVITNDENQLRFKIVARITINNNHAAWFGADAATRMSANVVPNGDYFVAVAVDPRIASTTRVGINGSPIPEDNPEYYTAEFAVAPVFMNHVFTNQFVPDVTSLGSGTKFGPNAGLNGQWKWINILDRETNPLGKTGNFYGIFEIFAKPEMSVVHTTSFLYRRCVAALPSLCPSENVKLISGATSAKVASAVVNGEGESLIATVTLDNPIEGLGVGDTVTIGTAVGVVVGKPSVTKILVQGIGEAETGADVTLGGTFTAADVNTTPDA